MKTPHSKGKLKRPSPRPQSTSVYSAASAPIIVGHFTPLNLRVRVSHFPVKPLSSFGFPDSGWGEDIVGLILQSSNPASLNKDDILLNYPAQVWILHNCFQIF